MREIETVLDTIIQYLSKIKFNNEFPNDCELITFLDKRYPRSLRKYMYSLPIVYFYGNIKLLDRMNAVVVTYSPSYYAQKIIKDIRLAKPVLCLKSSANSITKESYLCDIIYCNDISELATSNALLAFSFNHEYNDRHQLELFSLLLKTVYVVEGYVNGSSFQFISDCIDNQVIIKAVPTNIYFSGSQLPNKLLEQGISPLLLN